MPDLKISQLTAGDPAQGTDEIPAARSGANVRVTAQSIADLHSDAVTSVNSQTGAVSLDASDVGAAAAAFTTIAVSGQSNVVADSTADTLTLAAGSNITITTDAGTDTVTIAASGTATPSDFQPAIVTGNYYTYKGLLPNSADVLTPDVLYAIPIWFSSTETWTRIGVDIFSGEAAKSARLGIYANSTSNRPGALLLDAGTVSVATATPVEATISQSLTANTLYWLSVVTNSTTAQFRQAGSDLGLGPWVYGIDDPVQFNDGVSFGVAHAFGALPDPFGTVDTTVGIMPLIWLRKV